MYGQDIVIGISKGDLEIRHEYLVRTPKDTIFIQREFKQLRVYKSSLRIQHPVTAIMCTMRLIGG